MQSYEKGDLDISYTYDSAGLRGSKTIANGEKITYQYVGDVLYYQHTANADGTTNNEMYFYYDSYGKLSAIRYYVHTGTAINEYTYYVLTNSQGDVLALYGGDGLSRVRYEYDTWGKVLKVYTCSHATVDGKDVETLTECTDLNNFAHRNPFRYRSYYYDVETGLYYLQSRYYNPEIGRFLNADGYLTTGQGVLSYNMFAYCGNNPVGRSDIDGRCWTFLAALGFCLFVGNIINTAIDLQNATKPLSQSTIRLNSALNAVGTTAGVADDLLNSKNELDDMTRTRINYVQNVVDVGSAAARNESYIVTSPNKKVFANDEEYQELCRNSYSTMLSKTTLELNRDINGISWNDLSPEEQTALVNTIGAWDSATAMDIGLNCSSGVLKELL